jgi:tRNA U34 2-thiouridine synthase MnmA/TrmU
MRPKAIALLSGGLDSILAVRLILDQGIEVEALNSLPICWRSCSNLAKAASKDRSCRVNYSQTVTLIDNP